MLGNSGTNTVLVWTQYSYTSKRSLKTFSAAFGKNCSKIHTTIIVRSRTNIAMQTFTVVIFLSLSLFQLCSNMPVYDDYGLQDDRGFQSCSEDCIMKKHECLDCPELSLTDKPDDGMIAQCQARCTKKHVKCMGSPGDSGHAPTGCYRAEVKALY